MKNLIETSLRYAGRAAAAVAAFLVLCYPFSGSGGAPMPPFGEYLVGVVLSVVILAVVAAIFAVFPLTGAYVATQKGRPTSEGAILGLILGPFGVLIELLLPTLVEKP